MAVPLGNINARLDGIGMKSSDKEVGRKHFS